MKTVIPDYYKTFRCIASDCRHTCCAGWEIDVDRESAEKYAALGGNIGDELRACMEPAPEDERNMEYLIWRHVADALYDDRLDERVAFIEDSFEKITGEWHKSDNPDIDALIEICRKFSNEVEYGIADMLTSYQ